MVWGRFFPRVAWKTGGKPSPGSCRTGGGLFGLFPEGEANAILENHPAEPQTPRARALLVEAHLVVEMQFHRPL